MTENQETIVSSETVNYGDLSLEMHEKFGGKLAVQSKVPLKSRDDLSKAYTPGVAAVCTAIAKHPEDAYKYTWKKNTVAVVSDGSAVLGLGNLGGLAGLPVMEGKAILFKRFADVDSIPIVLSTQNPQEIIKIVQGIAPTFGGINLEDISAPNCFFIEEELRKTLNIPVFHDDQHGTAIVVLAGLINALKLVHKSFEQVKVVISGAGSAGIAIGKLLHAYGVQHIVMLDSKGIIHQQRTDLNQYKSYFTTTNLHHQTGGLINALVDADIFVGVSQPNLMTAQEVKLMAKDPIIFALSNPTPEIMPEESKLGGATIIGTGRSDFPNQVNNALAFPGLFRGVLDARIPQIHEVHKIAAAQALANYVKHPSPEKIIPSLLDEGVAEVVAKAVMVAVPTNN